jgi:16S rRNA (guanine1207-N2)-methyltransferase
MWLGFAMKPDHLDTMLLPFTSGQLEFPKSGQSWAFFNAQVLPETLPGWDSIKKQLVCEQAFRPEYIRLEKAGYMADPDLNAQSRFSGAMILLGRVRAENERAFQRACDQLHPGSPIVVCGTKTCGVHSFRKWVGNEHVIADSLSKHHAIGFWTFPKEGDSAKVDTEAIGNLFSGGKPDRGSMLLAAAFDERIRGKVADLGAGWGYLARELVTKSTRIESIDLYEADWHSLEHARRILPPAVANRAIDISCHWIDVLQEFQKKPFDWVVMNPPFHHGLVGPRSANADIGKAFIRTAASTLMQGGRLLMVANRALPYEAVLGQVFRKITRIAEADGYKVIEAVR